MDKSKNCCATCSFYGYCDQSGEMICNDYDGLYFQCVMKSTERCPDYIRKVEVAVS